MKVTLQEFKSKLKILPDDGGKKKFFFVKSLFIAAQFHYRLLCTGDFIFSSSYDKTVKAWLFDTSELDEGSEDKACIRTFKGHSKGVYPLIFIPGLF